MLMVVLLLAQVAAATTPVPPAAPKPTPVPVKYGTKPTGSVPVAPAPGLGDAAGKIKLNRGVSFDQGSVPAPAPTPKPGSKEAIAEAAAAPKSGITPERQKMYEDRYSASRKRLEDANAAISSATAVAPPCVTTTWTDRNGNYKSFTDCGARDGSLVQYKEAVSAAEREMTGVQEDCRRDAWCQPTWVPYRR